MIYIVALGKGIELLRDGKVRLRVETKLTALATVAYFKKGVGEKIIFSGGHTKGKDKPSEARVMFDFVKQHFPEISLADIILEEKSVDTADNAFWVKKILPQDAKIILITTSYHLPRSKKIFKNYSVLVDEAIPAEKILQNESGKFDFVLRKYNYRRKLREIIWESVCLFLVDTIDPKGMILRVITSKTRN